MKMKVMSFVVDLRQSIAKISCNKHREKINTSYVNMVLPSSSSFYWQPVGLHKHFQYDKGIFFITLFFHTTTIPQTTLYTHEKKKNPASIYSSHCLWRNSRAVSIPVGEKLWRIITGSMDRLYCCTLYGTAVALHIYWTFCCCTLYGAAATLSIILENNEILLFHPVWCRSGKDTFPI